MLRGLERQQKYVCIHNIRIIPYLHFYVLFRLFRRPVTRAGFRHGPFSSGRCPGVVTKIHKLLILQPRLVWIIDHDYFRYSIYNFNIYRCVYNDVTFTLFEHCNY